MACLLLVTSTCRQTISKYCFTYIINHNLVMTNPYIIPHMFCFCFRPEHSHVKLSLCIISIPVILYLICRDGFYYKLSDWLTISNILCVIAGISTLLFILQDMGYFSISERLVTMFVYTCGRTLLISINMQVSLEESNNYRLSIPYMIVQIVTTVKCIYEFCFQKSGRSSKYANIY